MINFENTDVIGWEHAIRGMRNPMNSWDKIDSCYSIEKNSDGVQNEKPLFIIGKSDFHLMEQLRNAGTDHRKFMRMITVYVDIIAPLYWWKEFDTYKVGTVANSCSTMHKIAAKEFTLEDFSCEHLIGYGNNVVTRDDTFEDYSWWSSEVLDITITGLNFYRKKYLETKDKKYWWQMIQLLPSSYNQRRTVMLNYEVLANIYSSRKDHKLDEWRIGFMDWIRTLPYSNLITQEYREEKIDE